MLHQTTHAFLATKSPLGLRRFGETDLGTLFDIESDPFLKQYVGGSVKTSRSEWICNAARITQSENQYALEHIPTGFLAGRLSLGHYDGPDNREIQVILAKNFVGQGFGKIAVELAVDYACGNLGAKHATAVVDPAHAASIRLVTGLGFTESPQSDERLKRIFVLQCVARGA